MAAEEIAALVQSLLLEIKNESSSEAARGRRGIVVYSQLLCLTSIFHDKYVKTILNATMSVACRRRHFSKKCETELSKQVEPPSWDSDSGRRTGARFSDFSKDIRFSFPVPVSRSLSFPRFPARFSTENIKNF